MSAPAFTPGPWKVVTHGQQPYVSMYIGTHDLPPSATGDAEFPIQPYNRKQTDALANAYLIAAAPDQNASLTELLAEDVLFAWVNETGIGKIEYQRRSAIIERARAALAKACGETP